MAEPKIDPELRPGMLSKRVLLRTLLLFLVSLAVLTVAVELLDRMQITDEVIRLERTASEMVTLQEATIHGELGGIGADLLFLAAQNELHEYLDTGDTRWLDAVASEYLALSADKAAYDQIRFLDERGMEIVRVDYHAGSPAIVPDASLQSKADRYYYIRSFILEKGQIYVSPFDLNIEHGQVELPWKPVIRFATPVFDESGRKRGVVILNYLGDRLLSRLRKAGEGETLRVYLADSESYWLLGPAPEEEWGFMFYGEGVRTVDTSFPGAWDSIRHTEGGHFRTDAGLFAFGTIDPSEEAVPRTAALARPSEPEIVSYRWKLIAHVPADALSTIAAPIRRTWGLIYGLLGVLSAALSWFFAWHQVARTDSRRRIAYLAKYDSLTGVCNRHFFEQTISAEVARARRYNHPISFLMVDVTRFKRINDTHGHGVGDEVLQEVAGILKSNVRETDIVVRYGGDEFLIMFPETLREGDAARERILASVDRLNAGTRFGFPIVLALGSAHWSPASNGNIEQALQRADERMYEHKQSQHAESP